MKTSPEIRVVYFKLTTFVLFNLRLIIINTNSLFLTNLVGKKFKNMNFFIHLLFYENKDVKFQMYSL